MELLTTWLQKGWERLITTITYRDRHKSHDRGEVSVRRRKICFV